MQYWNQPNGGIHGYLKRFLNSGDATFQHIAIWTLLQLLESDDSRLVGMIEKSKDIMDQVSAIAMRDIESDDEGAEDGEAEVVGLARRCLELLGKSVKTMMDS